MTGSHASAAFRLRDEGVLVLGIVRGDSYLGVPDKHTLILAGDTLILFGRDGTFVGLTARQAGPEGERAHELAPAA